MTSTHDLEAQRQTVLARMQAHREKYRRMLMDYPDTEVRGTYLPEQESHRQLQPRTESGYGQYGHYGHSFAGPTDFAHNPAVQWVKQHPLLCVAVVAAVVAIGPRRILKSAVAGGSALTALTLRNQSNVDTLGRVISTVAGYLQRERANARYR
jgi:hypothetical protein